MKRLSIALIVALLISNLPSASAVAPILPVTADRTTGYARSLFKHWTDVLHDGCTARKEVLLQEAITPPKVSANCFITGGVWIDPYSGNKITQYSKIDIDHLVPLAEAWRSGAYAWSAAEREFYANDIADYRTLVAVSPHLNREKSDQDISQWQPTGGYMAGCEYVKEWIAVKLRFSLSVDPQESAYLQTQIKACKITDIQVKVLPGFGNPAAPRVNLKKKSVVKK
jgi:hypothetical protein